MATKKTTDVEKAAPADEAPAVKPPKPAAKAKAPELTPDQAMVYAALGLGEQA